MVNKINEMFEKFGIDGEFVGYKMFKSGHINTTCMVTLQQDKDAKNYVLQKINKNVFKKPDQVMKNIASVTNFIRKKLKNNNKDSYRRVLNFQSTPNGDYYAIDEKGEYWRIYEFVDNSVTFDGTDNLDILEETGKAFGEFQSLLADYPSHKLYDIIPNFHNTPSRYATFKNVVANDPVGRTESVKEEISKYLKLEKTACRMQKMLENGELPLRVTHNDTKCNNVLFDEDTNEHICVIDLDTVMPGLVGFDFGDAIRFAGNTCAEDETDLSKVKVDPDKFRAFTKGFLSAVGDSLTKEEIDTLVLGAITMTTECGLRFLTDHIDGDNYFGINYPQHNLDRARCQLALAVDLIKNYNLLNTIVYECANSQRKHNDNF